MKDINCPFCNIKVATYDGRGRITVKAKCPKCSRLICYFPDTGKIERKLVPQRTSSSGVRFY